MLPEAAWQRCYVHFLRNALDHLPRKASDDCLTELRWLYDLRSVAEAQKTSLRLACAWAADHPRLCAWVEESIAETRTFYRLPLGHHKHLKSTNMLERLNEEIKRRTRVVRIFPNQESCLRLIRALAVETHEGWLEEHRYLNMDLLVEHKRELLRQLEEARPKKTSSGKTSSYRDLLLHNLTSTTITRPLAVPGSTSVLPSSADTLRRSGAGANSGSSQRRAREGGAFDSPSGVPLAMRLDAD